MSTKDGMLLSTFVCLSVCLPVCLLGTITQKLLTDFDEIFRMTLQ